MGSEVKFSHILRFGIALCAAAMYGNSARADLASMKFGYALRPGTSYQDAMVEVSKAIDKATQGEVRVNSVPLSDSKAVVELLRSNDIQVGAFFPENTDLRGLDIAAVPGVLDDLHGYRKALDDLLRPLLAGTAAAYDLHFLATGALSGSAIFLRRELGDSTPDLKNLSILVHSEGHAEILKLFGAKPQIAPTGEFYSRLEEGGADGALMDTSLAEQMDLHAVARTAIDWPFGRLKPWVIAASRSAWQTLSEAQQKRVEDSIRQLQERAFEKAFDEELTARRTLQEEEVIFIGLRPAQFSGRALKDYLQYRRSAWAARTPGPSFSEVRINTVAQYGTGGGNCPDHFKHCDKNGCMKVCE